ncbi:MAG: tellurium resistance protein [Gemmobacter sp.]|nr:tellurium resistance protein [Gemmobacter sp.]
MTRPIIPPPVFGRPPVARGLFATTPPAIFPPVLGLFGLGLAWRRGAEMLGLPIGVSEMVLGAVSLLYLFALVAYLSKVMRRPAVLAEDLDILPGRAGVVAASLSMTLLAAALVPYAPGLAFGLGVLGLCTHLVLAVWAVWYFLTCAPEKRVVTPVWHLIFVGFILGGLVWEPLGVTWLVWVIVAVTIPAALVIWATSAVQFIRRVPPAPLRPLLAIHLAPASLFATVLTDLGQTGFGAAFAGLALVILAVLSVSGRWLTETGFSPMWGAFTFPVAACASAVLVQGWDVPGAIVLLGATIVVVSIAVRVMQAWVRGDLAAKTNSAVA